ncbi:MAG: hypothetical protein ACI4OZ_09210 [Akkermansia sp.]
MKHPDLHTLPPLPYAAPRSFAAIPGTKISAVARPHLRRVLIEPGVRKFIQKSIEIEEELRTCNQTRSYEATVASTVTYMVILRSELAKQQAYSALLAITPHPGINRHKVKHHVKTLLRMVSKFDAMLSQIAHTDTMIDYYDGLTDTYNSRLARLIQTARFSIMQAVTDHADLPAVHLDILSRCQLANILLEFCARRIDHEIAHFRHLVVSLENLRYLTLQDLHAEFRRLNDQVATALFPQHLRLDLNAEPEVVRSVKNLLAKMSSPTFANETIDTYNKTYNQPH